MARKAATQKGLLKFALNVGKESIDFFQTKYFDEKLNALPPKIDMIAFPDFSSGAMEHWGLIGYRETSLLYSSETNSNANMQSVAFVVAHELAHFVSVFS
jgi:aminopeptidase N